MRVAGRGTRGKAIVVRGWLPTPCELQTRVFLLDDVFLLDIIDDLVGDRDDDPKTEMFSARRARGWTTG